MSDRDLQPAAADAPSETPREEHWRAERHAAYRLAQGEPALMNPWRRFIVFEREVRSWPLFLGWTAVAGAAYYLAGYEYWNFRHPETGELDWWLIGVYWLVCASVVWLCWPLPKSRGSGGSGG